VIDIDKLLTNNPMAAERYVSRFDINLLRGYSVLGVLKEVRNLVHQGNRLLTHPVTSGTAPNGNPFCSVVVSAEAGSTDFNSVSIIENSIAVREKISMNLKLPDTAIEDFMLIDCDMIAKGGTI